MKLSAIVTPTLHQKRLDVALAQLFPDYSRSQLQQWIKNSQVYVNEKPITKQRQLVLENDSIAVEATVSEQTESSAESIPLDIIYEDDALLIVNKPIGLVVHPGAGNPNHTLVNALLYHAPELKNIPRAGIIHRLDKDTSGLLVVAKTLAAKNALTKQMQDREIHREYRAIVHGVLISGGTIDAPIARHPTQRTQMAVTRNEVVGKKAVTHYRILERFREHTLLSVQLETGRTHQIRVHLSHIHCPIVGDQTYCKRRYHYPQLTTEAQAALRDFNHQALHACKLALHHPVTGVLHEWKAPIPEDMRELAAALKVDNEDF